MSRENGDDGEGDLFLAGFPLLFFITEAHGAKIFTSKICLTRAKYVLEFIM